MDPAAQGITYPDVAFVVDPDRVAAFRAVFGQSEGVPPTFATAAEFTVLPQVIGDPRLALDFARVVHGSQEYLHERPMQEGETLTVRAKIESVRVKGGSGFMTVAMRLYDESGELVCTTRSQMIERSADG